jgi:hypothetical protein
MPGSNLSVITAVDGTTKVPISTPVNDTNGNTVVGHLTMINVAGIATPVSALAPEPVIQAGGTPADFSSSAASVPLSGGYTLLTTVPVNGNRAAIEVQNQSAGTIQVVRDDGSAGSGTVSSILLAGAGAGLPGGSWASTTFKGRLRIYGASGAQVSAFQE